MSRDGFVDRSLIGLKDKLKEKSNEVHNLSKELNYDNKDMDKTFSKSLKMRKEEFFREKEYVLSKFNSAIKTLSYKKKVISDELEQIDKALINIDKILKNIKSLEDISLKDNDLSSLMQNIKIIKDARMEYFILLNKFSFLEKSEGFKLKKAIGLNEVLSLSFGQLFRFSLKILMPLIISIILASLILALAILFAMGVFNV